MLHSRQTMVTVRTSLCPKPTVTKTSFLCMIKPVFYLEEEEGIFKIIICMAAVVFYRHQTQLSAPALLQGHSSSLCSSLMTLATAPLTVPPSRPGSFRTLFTLPGTVHPSLPWQSIQVKVLLTQTGA